MYSANPSRVKGKWLLPAPACKVYKAPGHSAPPVEAVRGGRHPDGGPGIRRLRLLRPPRGTAEKRSARVRVRRLDRGAGGRYNPAAMGQQLRIRTKRKARARRIKRLKARAHDAAKAK